MSEHKINAKAFLDYFTALHSEPHERAVRLARALAAAGDGDFRLPNADPAPPAPQVVKVKPASAGVMAPTAGTPPEAPDAG